MASLVTTTAYAASKIGSATECWVLGVSGYNSKTSAQFIQIHDAAALPAEAAVPKIVFAAAASGNFSFAFEKPIKFSSGVVVCNSSTAETKTIGSADCWFAIEVA